MEALGEEGQRGDGDGTPPSGDGDASYNGDGDASYNGDGDVPVSPGDGDAFVSPGDGDAFVSPGDGDGDVFYGDGDGDGDGDVFYGDGDGDGDVFYGDGDGDIAVPPGIVSPGIPVGPPGSPGVAGEPLTGCEVDYREQSDDWCDLSQQCDQGYMWVSCWNEGEEEAYCNCEGEFGYSTVLVDAGIDLACGAAAEFCAGGSRVDPASQICETDYEDASSNYCDLERECVSAGESSEGIPVGISEWRSTWCEKNNSGWNCECWGNQQNLSLTFDSSSDGITPCREASAICDSDQIAFEGELQCERDYQSAYDGYCDVGLRCYQEATINNATVAVNGWAYSYCSENGEGDWGCTCDGMGVYSGFSIEGTDAWSSCEEAGQICARLIAGQ